MVDEIWGSENLGSILPLQLWFLKGQHGLGLFGFYRCFSACGLCLRIRVKYKTPVVGIWSGTTAHNQVLFFLLQSAHHK